MNEKIAFSLVEIHIQLIQIQGPPPPPFNMEIKHTCSYTAVSVIAIINVK